MRCSISSASEVRPSLRANSARVLSSRIAVRMSLMLWGSRRFIALPFAVDWLLCEGYPRERLAQPRGLFFAQALINVACSSRKRSSTSSVLRASAHQRRLFFGQALINVVCSSRKRSSTSSVLRASAPPRGWAPSPRGESPTSPPEELVPQPYDRVVFAVDRALLQRDQRVVRDLDVLGTHFRAALGDVAEAQAVLLLRLHRTLRPGVERVHVEFGLPHQVPGAGERLLVLLVVAHHVAGVLAQEALDALTELL